MRQIAPENIFETAIIDLLKTGGYTENNTK